MLRIAPRRTLRQVVAFTYPFVYRPWSPPVVIEFPSNQYNFAFFTILWLGRAESLGLWAHPYRLAIHLGPTTRSKSGHIRINEKRKQENIRAMKKFNFIANHKKKRSERLEPSYKKIWKKNNNCYLYNLSIRSRQAIVRDSQPWCFPFQTSWAFICSKITKQAAGGGVGGGSLKRAHGGSPH